MRYRTVAITSVLALAILTTSVAGAMMRTPDYWIGTEKVEITDTVPGVAGYTIPPHVCFTADGYMGYTLYCHQRTAIGTINPQNNNLRPYDSEEELPYRSDKQGELLPYNGSELLREDREGSFSTLHVCSSYDFGCTVEKIDDSASGQLYYQVTWHSDTIIRYENTDEPVHILSSSVSFSEYYNSPVAFDTNNNLLLIDTYTAQARVIGYERVQYSSNGTTLLPNVAIGGGNILVSNTENEPPFIHMYSIGNCNYGVRVSAAEKYPCRMWDIWNGTILGQKTQFSIKGVAPTGVQPYSPYFVQGDQISVVAAINTDDTDALRYVITSRGTTADAWAVPSSSEGGSSGGLPEVQIRLLALGDSYISGEGAYSYVVGTDTSDNKCHQSTVSYPYLLGQKYAAEYHSVACSGAVTDDIINGSTDYNGQVKSKRVQGDYSQDELDQIVSKHKPGYINQLKFITQDKPNVVLLSIGGNDAYFANVVTTCVLTPAGEPCFDSQSERIGLMNMVHGLHDRLRETYRSIKESSPGVRLYVMGYPQVVATTGTCASYVHLDSDERLFAKYFIDEINATVQNAADAEGAYYVDVSRALQGHRLCDSTDDAVNGLARGDDAALTLGSYTFGIGNESYHPTAKGHNLLGGMIADQTYNLTATSNEPTNASALPITRNKLITTAQPDNGSIYTSLFGNITNPVAVPGKLMQVDFDTTKLGIAPGTAFRLVFHSQEIEVASGKIASDGVVSATFLPPHVSYGGHTLHLYTTDKNGNNLDIIQTVFVVANELDYDGDGFGNATDEQPFINNTGKIIGGLFETETVQSESQTKNHTVITETPKTSTSTGVEASAPSLVYLNASDTSLNDVTTTDQGNATTKILGDIIQTNRSSGVAAKPSLKQAAKGHQILLLTFILVTMGTILGVLVFKHKRNKA